jgi:hypothetical protein
MEIPIYLKRQLWDITTISGGVLRPNFSKRRITMENGFILGILLFFVFAAILIIVILASPKRESTLSIQAAAYPNAKTTAFSFWLLPVFFFVSGGILAAILAGTNKKTRRVGRFSRVLLRNYPGQLSIR